MNATTIAVLKAESAKLKRQTKKLDDLIAEFENDAAPSQSGEAKPYTPRTVEAPAAPMTGDLVGARQGDACFAVLSAAAHPLSRQEMFELATARGAKIANQDHLSSILSRDDRFKSIGKGRKSKWQLASAQ